MQITNEDTSKTDEVVTAYSQLRIAPRHFYSQLFSAPERPSTASIIDRIKCKSEEVKWSEQYYYRL